MCTSKIDYHRNTASLLPIYPTLISTYRTLIYNGDVDGCVPYNGNEVSIPPLTFFASTIMNRCFFECFFTAQQWTSSLGFKTKEGWRPWMVMDQV